MAETIKFCLVWLNIAHTFFVITFPYMQYNEINHTCILDIRPGLHGSEH